MLTSTVFTAGRHGPGLVGFDFRSIPSPLLFVHDAEDQCPVCPYAAAQEQGKTYRLITVKGGRAAESDKCGPLSAHGFLGKEAETVTAIKEWMLGRPHPSSVE